MKSFQKKTIRIINEGREDQQKDALRLTPCIKKQTEGKKYAVLNGDTDSIKVVCRESNREKVIQALGIYSRAVDRAKEIVMRRVESAYPDYYDELKNIGHYELEFEVKRFCASWNKAYCTHDIAPRDGKRKFAFTLAGIPARAGVNQAADQFHENGMSYSEICSLMLGYNVTYAHSVILLNARSFPEWGSAYVSSIEDYLGRVTKVYEPAALCLYPMSKTVNDTRNFENRINGEIAKANNPKINTEPVVISRNGERFLVVEMGF